MQGARRRVYVGTRRPIQRGDNTLNFAWPGGRSRLPHKRKSADIRSSGNIDDDGCVVGGARISDGVNDDIKNSAHRQWAKTESPSGVSYGFHEDAICARLVRIFQCNCSPRDGLRGHAVNNLAFDACCVCADHASGQGRLEPEPAIAFQNDRGAGVEVNIDVHGLALAHVDGPADDLPWRNLQARVGLARELKL